MKIYSVKDKEFSKYGKVLNIDAEPYIKANNIPMPQVGSVYHASETAFESLGVIETLKNECFGELPIEVGCCYGHNSKLNALEWHKNSEINIALTDFILLLGDIREMEEDGSYDSSNVTAFKVNKGEAIEVYATTLHFCPIETSEEGFVCVVVLPSETNIPLDKTPEDKLLFRKNKWLIAHVDNAELIAKGVQGKLYGTNYTFENGKAVNG
ncbi:MAG: DUF4867 family protein [Clostridia bacterium]|nr:DUF4867 family protein [Clostridia bacterium]